MNKILLVDDAPMIIKIVSLALKSKDIEIDSAGNYDEAMARIETTPYQFGIFDMNMPGKNGIELLQAVKEHPNGESMQVIMLTTETATDLREKAQQAGAVAWLTKPFQEKDLHTVLAKLNAF